MPLAISEEMTMARAQTTTDHQTIRRWIEARNGHPSVVRATEGTRRGSAGLLRVDFDEPEDALEQIGWDDFFDTFDTNNLAFLYQNEKDSRFHKFVNRDAVEDDIDTQGSTRSRRAKSSRNTSRTRQANQAAQQPSEEFDDAAGFDEETGEDFNDDDENS